MSGEAAAQADGETFEIEIGRPEAPWHANGARVGLTVVPDPDARHEGPRLADGRPVLIHKTNAIKRACTPDAYMLQWAVGRLNGVRVYVQDQDGQVTVVVTTKDLNP